jgi:1-acyl-sn-glycerol-3-phosphate acyltransferase
MLKHFYVSFIILSYIISTAVMTLFRRDRVSLVDNGRRYISWVLRALGVRYIVRGKPEGPVFVSNHLSFIDVFTLLSILSCRFVTFTELGRVPGIGIITSLSHTLLIHRSQPRLVKQDIEVFEKELLKGVPFVFFPEGSSFDGETLRPFKSSLFESAIRTGSKVQPVCLRYLQVDGEPITLANRDRVFYHGDMQLLPQLLGMLKWKSLVLEVVFCEPIESKGKTRKELAQLSHEAINQHFLSVRS